MKMILLILFLLPSLALAKKDSPSLEQGREKNKEIFFRSHKSACERNDAMTEWLVSYNNRFHAQDIHEAASLAQNEFNQASDERDARSIECWSDALQKIHNMVVNVEDEKLREQLLQDLQVILHGPALELIF
jgi:hypothetical protein